MNISLEELKAIPAPVPTSTWNPIPHYEIYQQVEKTLKEKTDVEIINTRIDSDKNGNSIFVTHSLDLNLTDVETKNYPQLGWRNSINKKLSLGFTSGTHIIVCSNLVFTGSWIEFRKHTHNLDLNIVQIMVIEGVINVLKSYEHISSFHNEMLEHKRDRHHADHLFMEMLRKGIVSSRQVLDLSNAYDEEKARYGENLHTIFNCATQCFRELALPTISERSGLLNDLIKDDMVIDVEAETVH
jgi:hypothetical protein